MFLKFPLIFLKFPLNVTRVILRQSFWEQRGSGAFGMKWNPLRVKPMINRISEIVFFHRVATPFMPTPFLLSRAQRPWPGLKCRKTHGESNNQTFLDVLNSPGEEGAEKKKSVHCHHRKKLFWRTFLASQKKLSRPV